MINKKAGTFLVMLCLNTMVTAQQLFYPLSNNIISPGAQAKLNQSFNNYQLLDVDANQLAAKCKAGDKSFTLLLNSNIVWEFTLQEDPILSEDCKWIVETANGIQEKKPDYYHTYQGYVNGNTNNKVRLFVSSRTICGIISYNEENYFIEPLAWHSAQLSTNKYIVYRASDTKQNAHCALEDAQEVQHRMSKQWTSNTNVLACSQLDIALAADYSLVTEQGSAEGATEQLIALLNICESFYTASPIEIQFNIKSIYISSCSTCDPWTSSTDATTLLNSFKSWGNNGGFGTTSYGTASLWTNRDFAYNGNASVAGLAFNGTLCETSRYNLLEHYAIDARSNSIIQAHEIGHNFGCSHTAGATDIMNATNTSTTDQWDAASTNIILNTKSTASCFGGCGKAPMCYFESNVRNSCNGVVQFTDKSTNNPTGWLWNFGDGTTSTEQHPMHVYVNNGTYSVSLVTTNSTGMDAETKNQWITVNIAISPNVSGQTLCVPASVALSASGSVGEINWYDAPVGGNLLHAGSIYNVNISATQTFYVEETNPGTTHHLGIPDNSVGTGSYGSNPESRQYFDVYAPFTLKSVKVYTNTAGVRDFTVVDISQNVVHTISVNVPAGESRVDLNFDMSIGYQYALLCTAGPLDFWRTDGATYPYTVNGVVSITESNANQHAFPGYYYFFYDWEIQESACISKRSSVTVTLGQTPAKPLLAQNNDTLSTNNIAGVTYQWYLDNNPIQGATSNTYVTFANGSYRVEASDQNGCTVFSDSVNVTSTNIAHQTQGIRVYPNPASESIYITNQNNSKTPNNIYVTDVLGKICTNVVYETNKQTIHIESLQPGIYFLNIKTGESFSTFKFLKINE